MCNDASPRNGPLRIALCNKCMLLPFFKWCDYNKILLHMKFSKYHNIRIVRNVENVENVNSNANANVLCVSSNFHGILNFVEPFLGFYYSNNANRFILLMWKIPSMHNGYWILNLILAILFIVHNIWMETVNTAHCTLHTEHWIVTINHLENNSLISNFEPKLLKLVLLNVWK